MSFRPMGIGNTSAWLLCCALFAVACDHENQDSAVAAKSSQLLAAPVTVTLTFDDQRVSQSVLLDALRAAGNLKGTFFVISSFINDSPGDPAGEHPEKLSLDQLLELERDGHEIGAHTRTHVELPALSADQQADEICGSLHALTSYGFGSAQPIVSFAYPYGSYDDVVEKAVASCGFTSARSVDPGPESIPPADAYATRTRPKGGSITKDDSLASIEDWISNADHGDWVQLIWHDIASPEYTPSDEYYQTREDFDALLGFLGQQVAQGHIAVKTVAEVMSGSAPDMSP